MANREHVRNLKQGMDAWNKWRGKNPEVIPNLSRAKLSEVDLRGANLSGVDLSGVNLSGANLKAVNLQGANLSGANLKEADLSGADLSNADLRWAGILSAIVRGMNVANSMMQATIITDVDLRGVEGLESVWHVGPTFIDIRTLIKSEGEIPVPFLRGVGVPDAWLEYLPSLTGEALQYYTAFISYSSEDEGFVKQLTNDLQGAGVQVWYAPEKLKTSEKLMPTIAEAIRLRDKILVVLSEHSLDSDWLDEEIETALAEELATGKEILFPIRVDDSMLATAAGWGKLIRQTRHIGDFTKWENKREYQTALERLLRDLKG